MKNKYQLLLFLFFAISSGFSQEVIRIEISGQIIVDHPDIEGVTVYNTSSNKGTITDKDGKFSIEVALNDQLEVSALQFEKFVVAITKEILETKSVTVFLVEYVNKLPEVIILPYGLTGDLVTDLNNVKTFNPDMDAIYFGIGNMDSYEFDADYKTEVENIAMTDNRMIYGVQIVDVVGLLVNAIFKSKRKTNITKDGVSQQSILTTYSEEDIKSIVSIPTKDIVEFVFFIEENNFDITLLEPKRAWEFLKFLKIQEKQFRVVKYGKE